jgi:hypothetical protein
LPTILFTDVSFTLIILTSPPPAPVLLNALSTVSTSNYAFTISGQANATYWISISGNTGYTPFVEPSAGYANFVGVSGIPYVSVSGSMTTSSQSVSLTGFEDGYHTFSVYLRDPAGNASAPTSITVLNAIQPPAPTTPSTTGNTLSWTGVAGNAYNVYINGDLYTTQTTPTVTIPTTISVLYTTQLSVVSNIESPPSSYYFFVPPSVSLYTFDVVGTSDNTTFSTLEQSGTYVIYGFSGLAYSIVDTTISTNVIQWHTGTVINGIFSATSVSVPYSIASGRRTYIVTYTYRTTIVYSYGFTIRVMLEGETDTIPTTNSRTLSIRELRSANVQPTGTNVAEYIGGREMVRQVLSKGRQQRFPDYSSYMKYLKGRAYIQRG